ncbi:MAG: PqqD family protein [Kiloniellaceae bacterium]
MDSGRFALRPHIMIERDHRSDEVILIDGHTGAICSCNAAAAALLLGLEAYVTEDDLVETLLAEFDVSEATARRDVGRFLDSLSAMGFVDLDEGARRRVAVA